MGGLKIFFCVCLFKILQYVYLFGIKISFILNVISFLFLDNVFFQFNYHYHKNFYASMISHKMLN